MTDRGRRPRQGPIGGVLVTLTAEGIALPAGLISAMVLTRGLGPESYGRFTVVASTVTLTEWLLIAVFARAVVKFVAEADDWRPVAATSFRLYLGSGLAIGAAVFALAGPVASALNDPLLADYFRLFAPQIPIFSAGASCRNILAGQARYREQAATSAVGWIARVSFIVLFVRLGYGIEGAILGSIAGTLFGAVAAIATLGGAIWRPASFPARQLLQLALPAFLSLLFARLLDQVGLFSLEILAPDEATIGFYGAAMNVALVTSVIAAGTTPVILSTLTAARHGGDEASVRETTTNALRFGIALFAIAAVVAGSSGELALLLFGPAFGETGPLMALLMVAAVARAHVVILGAVLIALGRAWSAAWLVIPVPLVAIAAHMTIIPRYGALGAALVTTTLAIAAAIASTIAVRRIVEAPLPMSTIGRSIAVGSLVYLAAAWPTAGLLVLVKAAVLSVVALAGFLATGELSRAELTTLGRACLAAARGERRTGH